MGFLLNTQSYVRWHCLPICVKFESEGSAKTLEECIYGVNQYATQNTEGKNKQHGYKTHLL